MGGEAVHPDPGVLAGRERAHAPALRTAAGVLLVCAGYYLGGVIGLVARLPGSGISAVWLATAVLMVALLLVPMRTWWLYVLAVLPFHLHMVRVFQGDVPIPVMFVQYGGNMAHALLAAALLRRLLPAPTRLAGLRDMAVFLIIAGVLVPAAVSLVTVLLFQWLDWVRDPWEAWRQRTLSNGIGAMVVVPLILQATAGGLRAALGVRPRRYAEFCLLLLGMVVVGAAALGWTVGLEPQPALLCAPLPLLLWAAVRFGPGGLCLGLLLVAVTTLWNAMAGRGPFVAQSPVQNAFAIQLFLVSVSMPLLLLSSMIQEHRGTMSALGESQGRLETLLESVDGIVWEGDPATLRFTLVSAQAERLLGYPRRRWLDEPKFWVDHLHPDDRDWAVDLCVKATAAGQAHDFEYRMLAADGRVVWLRDLVSVETAGGRPVKARGVMVDISKRKRDEEALRASEERYREVVESQTDLVCRYERDTTLTFVNEAYCRFFARPREELIGRRFVELVPERARQAVLDRMAGLADHGVAVDLEHEVLLPDGSTGWHHWVDYAIRDAAGRVVELQGIGRDITARRRAEEALRRSEGRFRTLVRDFHVGVMLFGPRLEPLMINPAALELLALTESDFLAQDPWTMGRDVTRDNGLPIVPEEFPVMLAIASREPVRNVVMGLRRGEGEDRRWLLVDAAPQLGPDGEVTQVVCTLSDITELKRAQERLSLLQTITLEMAGASGLEAALEIVVRRVCEKTGWEFGQAWLPDEADRAMVCGPAWFRGGDEGMERFRAISRGIRFSRGEGLPGRVWGSGEAEWVRDVTKDPNFPRGRLAGEIALKAALAIPIRAGDELIAVIEFFLRAPRDEDDRLVNVITAAAAQLGLVIERQRAGEALRASYAEIQDLAGRLIRAQEEERGRIARELHDDLSQRLAALSLGLSALKKHIPADRLVEVKRVQDQAADVSSEIRGLSHRLHPGLLRHTGLGPALRSLCGEMSGHGGTSVRYVADEELPALEPDVALCLYRVAQEALGNAQRHSGASVASVILARTDGVLRLTVCDDGKGFDAASARRSGGMGLISMEERVRLVRGTIRVDSHPGRGTELRVEVPLKGTNLIHATAPGDPGG